MNLADLTKVKQLLNITSSDYDTELLGFISAASRFIENYTDRQFHFDRRKEEFTLRPNTSALFLRALPIDSIVLVQEEQSRTNYEGNSLPTGDDLGDLDSLTAMTGGAGTWDTVLEFDLDKNTGRILLPESITSRNIRVVYDGGYVVDFENSSVHTLPEDISTVCEKVAVKLYKRREDGGYTSQSFQDGSVQYMEAVLDAWSKMILNSYRNHA